MSKLAGFIFEGVDWQCVSNCVEDCREKNFTCVAKCIFLCTKPSGPGGDDGGSAFLDVLDALENVTIGIEENPGEEISDLLRPLEAALERYRDVITRR
ncbi:hypothetical protein ACFV28_12780 [Streptomyces sp. NPDC059720]|uniref:hypothetical protein n=1 Tax=Streptomyces sp. NPDC059720 TaxID=3346924 RepID=UPI0036804219